MSSTDPATAPGAARRSLNIVATAPTYAHPDWRGSGVSKLAVDFSKQLADRGHRVTLVSVLQDLGKTFDVPAQLVFPGAGTGAAAGGSLTLAYVPGTRSTRFGPTRGRLRHVLGPLLARADVVHCHSFLSPWADGVCAMARAAGVPYCVQDHGKLTPDILKNRGGLKKLYLRLRGWRLLEDAACWIPSADPPRLDVAQHHPKITARVVTNGVDPAEYAATPPRPIPEPYVLFLGWLDPRKNPDLLVRAFARVCSGPGGGRGWKLALVGPDSYGMGQQLRALVEQLGLAQRVVMPGPVKGEAKLAWFKNAGLFVLPSAGEGLSVAMIEALACGLPCLLTPGCNYPEIAGDTPERAAGAVLPLEDDPWAGAMERYILDDALRATAAANAARMFAERHTLERTGAAMEKVLTEAASARDRT